MRNTRWLLACALIALSIVVGSVHADEDRPDGAASDGLADEASPTIAQPGEKPNEKIGEAPGERLDAPSIGEGEVIIIEAEAPYVPVASRSVRDRDFRLRPHPRPADILRVVPGVFVNQHAGGGKANQYFLRGFDADHGTDIALSFDGIPANMVSHGHGHGYADLNWVIPEVVESIDTFKGTYAPRLGDFATAGSVDLAVRDEIARSSLSLVGGLFDTYRGLGMIRGPAFGGWQSLAAAELYRSDGPFDRGENHRRYSLYSHAQRQLGPRTTLKLAATSYMGAWNGSGQIPLRAVEAGTMSRFGAVDPSEGGESQRHSVYAKLDSKGEGGELSALVYLVRYQLDLFSNFTFFSADPMNGDQIAQRDERWYAGVSTDYRVRHTVRGLPVVTTMGLQGRGDLIATDLSHAVERQRDMTRVDADIRQGSAGAFVQQDIAWTPWLRSVAGLRLDYFGFDVTDHLGAASGSESALRASPKGSLVLSPASNTDVYLNAGLGFHSNDARSLVGEGGTPLTPATGYELGARSRWFERVDVAGSLWLLDLDSEIVWVGDEGVTEARGPTRRLGVELEVRAKLLDWLSADGDLTVSRARFRDLPRGEDRVPLAPRLTLTGGLSAQHPGGVYGRLGLRSLSDRPLTEDGFLTAEGFTLLDMTVGYRSGSYEVTLAIDNLLDAAWREAQFATTSRLASEADTASPPPADACPAGTRTETGDGGNFVGCEDVHFTPGTPLNAMLTAKVFF